MIKLLLLSIALQTPADSAHFRQQMRRLDSVRVAMDSLRRWCRVASYQTPKYLRRACPIALASPDARARWAEDSLIMTPGPTPPPPPDTTPPPSSSIAELPRVVPAYRDPYPGRLCDISVAATGLGADVTSALAQAVGTPGKLVVCLASAAIYGQVALPGRVGTDTATRVLRTSGTVPTEGIRVRPSTSGTFATIQTPNSEPALRTTPGTFGWYIVGIRFTTTAPVGGHPATYDIVRLGSNGTEQDALAEVPQRIVLSRVWIDGSTVDVKNCLVLNTGAASVVDSWIGNCHNTGQEGHGITSWNGPGPHLVKNSHIEAVGINTLWGGATPSIANLRAADLTITGNHFYTPGSWKGVWSPRKNHLELKNATRTLIEGNVFDGSWEEASHGGVAIVFKSINDNGDCTWCQTSDVTVRRNHAKNIAMGWTINGQECYASTGCAVLPPAAARIHLTENVFDIVNAPPYTGYGRGTQLGSGATDLLLERTVIAGGNLSLMMMTFKDNPVNRATFRDNVWAMGAQALHVDPGGGQLADGVRNAVWERMTLVGTVHTAGLPPSTVVASESAAPLAAQIRSIVQQATAGVVVPP